MSAAPAVTRRLRLDAIVAIALAAVGALVLAAAAVAFRGSAGEGYDLRAYLDAAHRIASGQTPYNQETLAGPFRPGPFGLYLYPPPLAVALQPIAGLPVTVATAGWLLVRIGALVVACAVLPVPATVRAAVFGTSALSMPTLLDLNLGNVSVIVLALAAVAWRALDSPVSGVALTLATLLRPPVALLALLLLVRRRWGAMTAAIVTGLVAVGLTLPFVGVGGWLDYFTVLRNAGGYTGVPRNVDASSAAVMLGMPDPIPAVAFLAFAAVAGAAVVLASRRDRDVAFVVTATATLLLAPLLWTHYLVLLALPAALLAARGHPWGAALPLLGWLPEPALPLAAVAATLTPLFLLRREAHDVSGLGVA